MNNDKDSHLDNTLRVWNNYWARISFEHWIQAKLSRQSQLKNTRLFKNGTVIINDTNKTNEWDILQEILKLDTNHDIHAQLPNYF